MKAVYKIVSKSLQEKGIEINESEFKRLYRQNYKPYANVLLFALEILTNYKTN